MCIRDRYFAVEEAELYSDPAFVGVTARSKRNDISLSDSGPIASRLFATPRPSIEPGFYQTFFSLPGNRDELICSITAIRSEGDRVTFRRLTGFAETRGTIWSHFRGDHEGVVLERFNWFFFVGLNRRDPKEPTFTAVRWGPFSPETLLCGHAMVCAQSGLTATTVVMRPLAKATTLRSALSSARTYAASDPAVGPLVSLASKGNYMPMSG